jgi:hypothetical protein
MKKNNLIIALCFLVTPIFSQNNPYKNDIKAVFDTVVAATARGDWDIVLDHTYPKIFDIAPREKMRELMMKTITNATVMRFTVIESKIDRFSNDTLVIDNELFTLFYANNKLQFIMTIDTSESQEDRDLFLKMMKASYEEKYGAENVTFDKGKATFDVLKKNGLNLCANNSPTRDKSKWTIMEVKLDKLSVMKKMLPNAVIDWIKSH